MSATASWLSYEDVIADASERLKDIAQHNVNPGSMALWASQANREFARRSEVLRTIDSRVLVLGQELYRLPKDMVRVERVTLKMPGDGGYLYIEPSDEEDLLDALTPALGYPSTWYLTRDRTQLGIRSVPSTGGFDGYTASSGNAGGTTVVGPSTMSATDDIYNGLTLRVLEGTAKGQDRVISDYVGSTKTMTVSVAFTAQVLAALKFQVHPDSLRIHTIKTGNEFRPSPSGALAVQAAPAPTFEQFAVNLPTRPEDYWIGWEVRFKSGTLSDHRVMVTDSAQSGANTLLTVEPSLWARPVAADTVALNSVPDTPAAWHDALTEWCLYQALSRAKDRSAGEHLSLFVGLAEEAKLTYRPFQHDQFRGVRMDDAWS